MGSNNENSDLQDAPLNFTGAPQLSPMPSLDGYSTPTSPISLDSVSQQNQTEQRTEANRNLLLPFDILDSLSNLLYNAFFRTNQSGETSSNTIRREKGNIEWFNLVYLHSLSPDLLTIQKIRRLINIVTIFNDIDDCIAYINSLSNQKIILISSQHFSDSLLSRIANLSNIFSIYILSEYPLENLWDSSLPIRGIYQSIDEIYEMISDDIKCDQFIFQKVYANQTTLDETFVFFQLLGDILLDRSENENAFRELIDFVRREYDGNEYELAQIDEFERTYRKTQTMPWLLRSCFLLKMLYRAMLLQEVDILFKLRLFIQDLNLVFEQETLPEPMNVYFASTIDQSTIDSIETFERNQNLLTFHQFLFASTDQSYVIKNAKKLSQNLLIRIDFPSAAKCLVRLDRYPSSSIDNRINIFINAGIMTKIMAIEKNSQQNDYVFIHLQFVPYADDVHLQEQIQTVRNSIQGSTQLFQLVRLLTKVNRQTIAEQFFSNLVNEDFLADNFKRQSSLSQCLEFLALIHYQKENFQRASELFPLCLKAYHRYLPADSSELHLTYRDLGDSLYRIGEYSLAIKNFQRALDTQFYSNTPDLVFSAFCCFKLGLIYFQQKKDQQAIQAIDRAERLLEHSGETHPKELMAIYITLADYFYGKEKYDDAIVYYRKVIQLQPNDPKELYSIHFTLATIYLKRHEYRKAMIDYERSIDYARQFLPEKHMTFVLLHNNIGYTRFEEREYAIALDHYSKGLDLASECLPDNHTLIGTILSNTALVYSNLRRFDEAIETMEKSIEQLKKTLSDEDEQVAYKRTLLDGIKRKKILHEIIEETVEYF